MTPAEITKLTEHARRAKNLMERSSRTASRAEFVMDNYEKTLSNFESQVERVSKEDAALAAAMAGMGNAGPVLDAAFQDDTSLQDDAPVSAKPSETAHLPETK
jgi:hypothetical protein